MTAAAVCWRCGKPATPNDPLTADHLTPLAQGGTNTPHNYAAAHRSCNSQAGAAITNAHGGATQWGG